MPGTRLYIPELPDYPIHSMGYVTLRTPELDQELISSLAPMVTYMALFEYHFDVNGNLSTLDDTVAIQTSLDHDSAPIATITNLTETGFNREMASQVLNNPQVRQNLINNIYTLLSSKGYAGVNIDIEGVAPEDRDMFSTFLRLLRDRLKPEGYLATIAVPPKTSDDIPWLKGYDYGAIGATMDLVFIMAYDWHHAGSEPGPVAPFQEVRRTIEYASYHIGKSKIILGVPRYGYDWTLPVSPESRARAISSIGATQLAQRNQVPIFYSEEFKAPSFHYVDENGSRHVVWFEDPRSFGEKFNLVREYQLRGMGAWQLGLGFPQAPWLMRKFFRIEKVI
jgi:spore germination protein